MKPPTPDTESARQRGLAVPRKARLAPDTRSDGRAYQSAPSDGRRVRWQSGASRVRLARRRWHRLEAMLTARDFAPESLALECHTAFVRRVRGLLESVFTVPGETPLRHRARLSLSAAEFHALRAQLHERLCGVRSLTSRERRLIGQRVRDWLNRNFIVADAAPALATTQGT